MPVHDRLEANSNLRHLNEGHGHHGRNFRLHDGSTGSLRGASVHTLCLSRRRDKYLFCQKLLTMFCYSVILFSMQNVTEASIERFTPPSSWKLADAMAAAGVSCAELAEAIGVDKRTVQSWRNGKKCPRLSRFELHDALNRFAR